MRISALLVVCGGLALSNAALAQDGTNGDQTTDVTLSDFTPEASAFDQLSPGNQKIVESLFGGQSIPEGGTSEAWSLNQIAGAKQDGQGWGQIFKQMKADGLVDAKNLGQLVSGQNKTSKLLKDGSGTTGGTGDTATTDPDGTGTAGGDATVANAAEPTAETGSFEQLSNGNQKIAESLFEGQTISGDGISETEAWSLNQIAGAKQDGQGWGQIFKQMKADGLVDAKNLGQLVSGQNKASKSVPTEGSRSGIVLTTASGRTMSFGRSKQANRGKGSLNSGSRNSGRGNGGKFSGFSGSRNSIFSSGHGSRASISSSGGNSGRGHGRK